MSVIIHDRTAPGVARVWVFDSESKGSAYRFHVMKIFRLANGKTRRTSRWYFRRPAAIRYADKWLAERVAAMGGGAS